MNRTLATWLCVLLIGFPLVQLDDSPRKLYKKGYHATYKRNTENVYRKKHIMFPKKETINRTYKRNHPISYKNYDKYDVREAPVEIDIRPAVPALSFSLPTEDYRNNSLAFTPKIETTTATSTQRTTTTKRTTTKKRTTTPKPENSDVSPYRPLNPDFEFFSPSDPCEFNPKMPNFYLPERRISEIKCLEYKWDASYREERDRQYIRCLNKKYHSSINFVMGSKQSEVGEYPHMGAIGWRGYRGEWIFKCGTSLISPRFTLTAAHCSRATTLDTSLLDTVPRIVRLGQTNIRSTLILSNDIEIKRFIQHSDYQPPRKYFDISLIELAKEVTFSRYLHPACLWTEFDTRRIGAKVTVSGWGVITPDKRDTPEELRSAEVQILDTTLCSDLLKRKCSRYWCGFSLHQICAGNLSGGVDACQGDSGGPLQVRIPSETDTPMYYVIGVTSFGIGCGKALAPGIYTRVSSFISWIEQHVWNKT